MDYERKEKLVMLAAGIVEFLIRSLLIMLVWNAVATDLFNAPVLTYWSAVGLNFLTGWLFRFRVNKVDN